MLQSEEDYYITNAFLTLKNEKLALEDRHRVALFAWSNDRVYMPPNKQKLLIDWIQQAILKTKSIDIDCWLTFQFFLEDLNNLSNFTPHQKLGNSFKIALQSNSKDLHKCVIQCIILCMPVLSYLTMNLLHWIACNLSSMNESKTVKQIIRKAYEKATDEKEVETVLKCFSDLPSEFDAYQLSMLHMYSHESVINMLFRHRPMFLLPLCKMYTTLVVKVASIASRIKQDEEWWFQLLTSLPAQKMINKTDLLRVTRLHPNLANVVTRVDPQIYHNLPEDLRLNDSVQCEFIKHSNDLSLGQMISIENLPCGPLSSDALSSRAAKSDKLEIVQALEKCKPDQIEIMLRHANISNLCFVSDIRKRVLDVIEPVDKPLLTKICLMLRSDHITDISDIELKCYLGHVLSQTECEQLWKNSTEKHKILHIMLYFLGENDIKYKILEEYANECEFNLDAFTKITDLVYFLELCIRNISIDRLTVIFEQASYCNLPDNIALDMLRKCRVNAQYVIRLAKSVLSKCKDNDIICEVVTYLQDSGNNSLDIAHLINTYIEEFSTVLISLTKVMQADSILCLMVFASNRLNADDINRCLYTVDLTSICKPTFEQLIASSNNSKFSSFFDKTDDENRKLILQTSSTLQLFIGGGDSQLDVTLINTRLINECTNEPDIYLLRLFVTKHHGILGNCSKQSLLCALPKMDFDLAVRVLRCFEEYYRGIPSIVCIACTNTIIALLGKKSFDEAERISIALLQVMRDPHEAPEATTGLSMLLLNILTFYTSKEDSKVMPSQIKSMVFSLIAKSNRKLIAHAVSCAHSIGKNKNIIKLINELFVDFRDTGRYDLKI